MKTVTIDEKQIDGTVKSTELVLPMPLGSTILVRMDEVHELKHKDSVILFTQQIEDRAIAGNIVGTVVDMGACAFKGERFKYIYGDEWPVSIGDKVVFKRSSGSSVPHSKGRYQYIDDQNVIAVYK